MTTTPLHNMVCDETGGTVARSLDARFTDVLNVLDFGAVSNAGGGNNTAAFQACFDAAFGTAAAPNGVTNSHLNKAVYIPNGYYFFGTTVFLNNVYGGLIFGEASEGTILRAANNSMTVLEAKGMSFTTIRNLQIRGNQPQGGDGVTAFKLDWNGSATPNGMGTVGLHGNEFENVTPTKASTGFIVGTSGNEGYSNTFNWCGFPECGTGMKIDGSAALNQIMMGCRCYDCGSIGLHVSSGSVGISSGMQNANSPVDIQLDSSDGMLMLVGGRTESDQSIRMGAGRVYISGYIQSGESVGGGPMVTFTGSTSNVEVNSVECSERAKGFSGNGQLYVTQLAQYDTLVNETRQDGTSLSGAGTSVSMWGLFTGTLHNYNWRAGTFAQLLSTPFVGMEADISDCNTTTFAATAAGSGGSNCHVMYNGTNWTVIGI